MFLSIVWVEFTTVKILNVYFCTDDVECISYVLSSLLRHIEIPKLCFLLPVDMMMAQCRAKSSVVIWCVYYVRIVYYPIIHVAWLAIKRKNIYTGVLGWYCVLHKQGNKEALQDWNTNTWITCY